MKVRIAIVVNVDPAAMGAEYGEDTFTEEKVRDYLQHDVRESIRSFPYAEEAITNLAVSCEVTAS